MSSLFITKIHNRYNFKLIACMANSHTQAVRAFRQYIRETTEENDLEFKIATKGDATCQPEDFDYEFLPDDIIDTGPTRYTDAPNRQVVLLNADSLPQPQPRSHPASGG